MGLDHLRALAALMVLCWHFTHGLGRPGTVPVEYVTRWSLLSLFEEGHTGVALFFTISGFIITYLCYGKTVNYPGFLKNRVIRLLPLIMIFFAFAHVVGISGWQDTLGFMLLTGEKGVFGMWTLGIEFQCYLFFPLFLASIHQRFGHRPHKYLPLLGLIALGIVFVLLGHVRTGNYNEISNGSVFGRISQFTCGAIACLLFLDLRTLPADERTLFEWTALAVGLFMLVEYIHYFNELGSFSKVGGGNPLWLWHPIIEGVCYGLILLGWISLVERYAFMRWSWLAYAGEISYSTYMVHMAMVPLAHHLVAMTGIPVGSDVFLYYGTACLLVMYPLTLVISALMYELLEKPFLALRSPYIIRDAASPAPAADKA
uniref:Putative acyltransferase n=1 Tax=uncultured bacterium CSL1 TaxID=1091565 RepID=G4WVB0_9BACT|nr:putative acyltransferase [uncultured bacterium CSL1]